MAWLYINSAAPEASDVGIISSTTQNVVRIEGRSHEILNAIAKLKKKKAEKIEGICVVAGPGSFTSIRTGVLIANLMARLEHVSLYGVELAQAQNLSALVELLDTGKIPAQSYVKPEYDAEPNITLAKAKTT